MIHYRRAIAMLVVLIANAAIATTCQGRPGGSRKYQMKKLLITLLVLFSLCSPASAASYTVCNSGCNYTTIAAAIVAVTNGTANTITVKSPYSANERVTVNKAGASDSSRLVIIADAGYTPVTKGFSVTSDYVTVNGFEMTSCGASVCAIAAADYVSFLNNNIHGSDGSGYSYECGTDDSDTFRDYVVLQGNKIHAGSSSGYTLMDFRCNYCTIDNNELYFCVDCDGMRFWGHDSVISNNYIHDLTYRDGVNHSDNFQTFGDCGSAACHTMYNYTIEKNLCISTGDDLQPFNLENDGQSGIHDIVIRNNIFMNFGTQGNVGIPNMSIVNNTFIDVATINLFALNILYGGGWDNSNLIIENNIFVYTYNQPPFTPDARTTNKNNYVTRRSGSSYSAVTGWSEPGGIYGGNPNFVNYTGTDTCGTYNVTTHKCSNFDVSLTASSPAKDAGADLSSIWSNATDKDGVSRPQGSAWDIGAYEYSSGSSQYTLTVTKAGTGSGLVTSSPSGINCGSTCSNTYTAGTSVTLNAAPDSGDSFTGWGGACSGTGACTVTMNAARTVTANFTLSSGPYTLTVTKSGTGTGTVTSSDLYINCGSTCSHNYDAGTPVTLTAAPDSGSFTGWSGACSGTGSCTVSMNAAKTVIAEFTLPSAQYTLTVTGAGTGSGTVTSSPTGISCGSTCSHNYDAGTPVTLTAAPGSGYYFTGWSGACSGRGSCTVSMNAPRTVTALFSSQYALTVTKKGTGSGKVISSPSGINCGTLCSNNYAVLTPVTLTAVPDSGVSFTGWEGACSGMGSCFVSMDAPKTVTATFTSAPTPAEVKKTSGNMCFIATAAYSSSSHPDVQLLRDFRDSHLLSNTMGRIFVNFYYQVSPPLADFIRQNEILRVATRTMLKPIIYAIKYPYIFLLLCLAGIILIVLRKRTKAMKDTA